MKRQTILLSILALILAACLVYLPYFDRLGLYRDDWNNFYTATVKGPEAMRAHYASDRPASGILTEWLFKAFGPNNTAFLVFDLCCRLLGSVCFLLTLFRVFPRNGRLNTAAGILTVLFPGFLQQADGIAYSPHQLGMCAFFISLFLTAVAETANRKGVKTLLTFFAVLLGVVTCAMMEYYVGMECYRLGILFLLMPSGSFRKRLLCTVRAFIPYMIGIAAFWGWRTFFFNATRYGTDVMSEVILPLFTHPKYYGIRLLKRMGTNILDLFYGSWTTPLRTARATFNTWSDAKTIWITFFITLLLVLLFLFAGSSSPSNKKTWILFGLLCGIGAITPLVMAGRDIAFDFAQDRFAWPGAAGSILFALGLISCVPSDSLRAILCSLLVTISVFVQLTNLDHYAAVWAEEKDYWQQLIWRAPGIEKGTLLLSSDGRISVEEDYELFCPANMIYYPNEKEYAPISAEVLNTDTVEKVKAGVKTERLVREIWTPKDFSLMLALTKPTKDSCLQVIDGANPIYSGFEWSRIREIGAFSHPERIMAFPETPAVYPAWLGAEQAHGWCYYYEKMSLAMQFHNAGEAAALADEADSLELIPTDPFENLPIVEAYLQTGQDTKAIKAAERLGTNAALCSFFQNQYHDKFGYLSEYLCEN